MPFLIAADEGPLGVSRDLSQGGLFVSTSSPPSVGQQLHIAFVWAHELVATEARVVRTTPQGAGLAFSGTDPLRDRVLQEILLR